MRKPFVAGNWKMYMTVAEARHMVSELVPGLQAVEEVEKAIFPPFTALLAVKALLEGTEIGLGAQNMYWETSGAYTGEISAPMLVELCQYVLIGHSERRVYFGETDEMVNRRVQAALAHGLTPIVCVGGALEEKQAARMEDVISHQLRQGLTGLILGEGDIQASANSLVIAYEPAQEVGAEYDGSAEEANAVAANIVRPLLTELFGPGAASVIRVLYGGSLSAANAAAFFNQPEIDGALVGGASLRVSEFLSIVQAARPV